MIILPEDCRLQSSNCRFLISTPLLNTTAEKKRLGIARIGGDYVLKLLGSRSVFLIQEQGVAIVEQYRRIIRRRIRSARKKCDCPRQQTRSLFWFLLCARGFNRYRACIFINGDQ